MKVSLRKKTLKDGRKSFYLDFWPPVKLKDGKETRREFLGMYLKPERSVIERELNRKTKTQAEGVRAGRQLEMMSGKYATYRSGAGIRFIDYMQLLADKRSDSTKKTWKSVMRWVVLAKVDIIVLTEMNRRACNMFRDFLLNSVRDKKLTAKSASVYLSVFKTALHQAYKDEYLEKDEASRLDRISFYSKPREYLTLDEMQRLIKTPIRSHIIRDICLFSALTGLRISDIRALTWDNVVDDGDGTAALCFKAKKTGKKDKLPIGTQARELIGERGIGVVFSGIPTTTTISKKIAAWVAASGINKIITMHCMRHTYATLQLSAGTDITVVSRQLQHSSIALTMVYAKVLDSARMEAANAVVFNM